MNTRNQLDWSLPASGCSCLSWPFCFLGFPWCFPLFGPGSASGFYSDFTSQLPDKISTGSTTYPQTQHWQAKLASIPNNFPWHPRFPSWLDLKTTIIFDASFLPPNSANNQLVWLAKCLFNPLSFKYQGQHFYFIPSFSSLDIITGSSHLSSDFQSLPPLPCPPSWDQIILQQL